MESKLEELDIEAELLKAQMAQLKLKMRINELERMKAQKGENSKQHKMVEPSKVAEQDVVFKMALQQQEQKEEKPKPTK